MKAVIMAGGKGTKLRPSTSNQPKPMIPIVNGPPSLVWEGADLDGALVGRSCEIRADARLLEGSTIGDSVEVGEGATIEAGVSIFPDKLMESGTVSEDIE